MGIKKKVKKKLKVIATFPNVDRGHQYALDVVSGRITASVYVIGACQRYLNDICETDKDWFFDHAAAEKYLRSVQKFEHVIGSWATPNIHFEPWQCFVWMNIYGFRMKATGYRRFRIAHLEVARGNAKSAMASQCSLYELALDNPNGNQISTVATKKDQARIVLDSSRAMARKNASYIKHTGVKVLAHALSHPKSNSVMRALAADSGSLDGLNDVLAVCDELHAMKRELFDVIYSGMSKRSDSLTLCITTAGSDVESVGHSQSAYAKKICLGEVKDDQFFAAVYTLDKKGTYSVYGREIKIAEDDDWDDDTKWIKPNPNLGVSVDPTSLRAKIEKALLTPADIPNIRIKHMNQWISEANAFYDLKFWDSCANPNLSLEQFKGLSCRMGLDLASHIDITSFSMMFRRGEKYSVFFRNYIPEETVRAAKNDIYDAAIKSGDLIATPGSAINYDCIRSEMESYAKQFRVVECLYDAWSATETAQKLSSKIEMVKIGMNVGNMSEPTKRLDALMREGNIEHIGAPIIRWQLGNVVAKEDHNGNVYPRKSHVKLKIDSIFAGLMALAGWLQNETVESVYEQRGLRVLGR